MLCVYCDHPAEIAEIDAPLRVYCGVECQEAAYVGGLFDYLLDVKTSDQYYKMGLDDAGKLHRIATGAMEAYKKANIISKKRLQYARILNNLQLAIRRVLTYKDVQRERGGFQIDRHHIAEWAVRLMQDEKDIKRLVVGQ